MRRELSVSRENSDIAVYKSQLAEIDRDIARGVLDPADAERTKVEISRRLLTAAKHEPATQTTSKPLTRLQIISVLGVTLVTTMAIYASVGAPNEPDQPLSLVLENADILRENRPSQAAMVAAAPPRPSVDVSAELLDAIAQLRVIAPTRPNDVTGWELLARYEAELLQFDAAAKAQERVIALKGATLPDLQRLLDLMVFAANGLVSKEAEAIAEQIIEMDRENTAAWYYIGAMYDQTGRPDRAIRIWRPMVESGADNFHIAIARSQIANAAARAGVDYEPPQMVGPDLETIAAAEGLSAEDRAEMVQGMVAQLSDRLATQGGSASEWARLIRAHGVLGEHALAQSVFIEAMSIFGSDPTASAVLTAAAQNAGVSK